MRCLVPCALAVLAGCPDRSIAPVVTVQDPAVTKTIPLEADIDLLFVIDNSGSTQDKQTVFAQNFRNFVAALDLFPTGRPNLHIGVVTSTVDTGGTATSACHPASDQSGVLQNASRDPMFPCAPPTDDRFLSDIAQGGGRVINYRGALDQALACISHVGDNGCGFEQPLEAMKRALDGSRPENAGFLRSAAFLAVVILTDEDDCSAQQALFVQPATTVGRDDFRCPQTAYQCDAPISPSAAGSYSGCRVRHDGVQNDPRAYAQFLSTVKKDPSRVAVALVAGESTTTIATGALTMPFRQDLALLPTCSATINGRFAIGRPAPRLHEFLDVFGIRGVFSRVCQSDYSQAVADIGDLLFRAVSPCLEGDLDVKDTDLANPGLQPDCTVSEISDPDTAAEVETVIARCPMTAADTPALGALRACWWVRTDPGACTTETQLQLHVERSAPPVSNSVVRVTCAGKPR